VRRSEEANQIVPVVTSDFDKKVEVIKEDKQVDLRKELQDHYEIDAKTFLDTKELSHKL